MNLTWGRWSLWPVLQFWPGKGRANHGQVVCTPCSRSQHEWTGRCWRDGLCFLPTPPGRCSKWVWIGSYILAIIPLRAQVCPSVLCYSWEWSANPIVKAKVKRPLLALSWELILGCRITPPLSHDPFGHTVLGHDYCPILYNKVLNIRPVTMEGSKQMLNKFRVGQRETCKSVEVPGKRRTLPNSIPQTGRLCVYTCIYSHRTRRWERYRAWNQSWWTTNCWTSQARLGLWTQGT